MGGGTKEVFCGVDEKWVFLMTDLEQGVANRDMGAGGSSGDTRASGRWWRGRRGGMCAGGKRRVEDSRMGQITVGRAALWAQRGYRPRRAAIAAFNVLLVASRERERERETNEHAHTHIHTHTSKSLTPLTPLTTHTLHTLHTHISTSHPQAWTTYSSRPSSEKAKSSWSPFGSRNFYQGTFEEEMTRREASLILGIRESASKDRVQKAHRSLLLLNHPDTGGSPLLATKLNEAKETLLGGKSTGM